MSDSRDTVLDHVENITVPDNVFAEPANEFWALVCFWHGMELLYHQAKKFDALAASRLGAGPGYRVVGMGNLPQLSDMPKSLLTVSFHWYAISACQYARVVGAIARDQKKFRWAKSLDYVKEVIPEVLVFRNKVAAHLIGAEDDARDNDAERLASYLPSLHWGGDSFYVGASVVQTVRNGTASTSTAIKPWSLCKVHEQLRDRYWPDRAAAANA